MIEINNVSKSYGNKKVIENLNLKIKDGEIIGFIGPNGAGKTTIINMMTGIQPITSGNILLNEHDIEKDEVAAKKEFGLVPDTPSIFQEYTAIEFIKFMADIYSVDRKLAIDRINSLVKEFEVEEYINKPMSELSHGTQQKMVVISVLVREPNIWILDEPLTGLDPNSAFKLKEKMKEVAKRGKTVLFSTHVLEVAEKLCTQIIIINKGKILYSGSMEELKEKYPETKSLEELFLKITK